MKKIFGSILCLVLTTVFLFSLTGCDLFGGGTDSKDNSREYNEEITSSTGKWYLLDERKEKTNTYFEFDGSKDRMIFSYTEDNEKKYSGTFRMIYRENTGKNATTLTIGLNRTDTDKEDYIYAYADDFETNFTQFTTFREERDEGKNDGRNYAHIYRIGELPFKLGTYVLEGNAYKQEKNNYAYADTYQIPEGTYVLSENISITFVMPKPYSYALFQYKKGTEVIEGVYNTATNKESIYLYIEHDPYQYIRTEDKENYDTTFSNYYPPDFYLRGNFDASSGTIVINGLYHHELSPTKIQDNVFEFGTYIKL